LQPVGRLAGDYVLSENIFACPVNDEVLQVRAGSRMRRLDDRDARWSPLIEKPRTIGDRDLGAPLAFAA
jgi:hypothetical protein